MQARNIVPTTGRLHGGVFGGGYGGAMGFGVIPTGSGMTPLGRGLYPFGSGLYAFGGAAISTTGMGRALYSRPKPYSSELRRVYMMPTRYQMYGGGVLDSFKAGAKRLVSKGKDLFSSAAKKAKTKGLQLGKDIGKQALDMGEKEAGKRLRDLTITAKHKTSGIPGAKAGIDMLSSQGSSALSKGSSKLRSVAGFGSGVASEAGRLTDKQVRALTMQKGAAAMSEVAPSFDQHEVRLLRNVVEGKRIVGRGLKKM
jgi:hypothetical protein